MYKNRTNNSEFVYQKLKEQILHLTLLPGSTISEIDTAAKYEISRTPVRDAFKMLESEGLLEIRPHVGTFVSLIDLNMISDTLYIREVLEQSILRDLAMGQDRSHEFPIRLLLQKQHELLSADLTPEDLSHAFILSDNEFHSALYELAGRKNVMTIFRSASFQYERFRSFLHRERKDDMLRLYEEHVNIWDYITRKDYDKLSSCISHHIYDGFNTSTELVLKHPDYFKTLP